MSVRTPPHERRGLRALLERAAQLAFQLTFGCPADHCAHRFLARMNFYTDLPSGVGLSRSEPRLRRRDRRLDLVELALISSSADVAVHYGRVLQVGSGQFGRDSAITTTFAPDVAATTANSVEHASMPVPAMMSAQRYNRNTLELAVVDLGVGFPTTLQCNPLYAELDDATAIEWSLVARR